MSDGGPFAILCVCTGNVCRSPAAERLLAKRLGPRIDVTSAGTHALIGQPVSPPMDVLIAGTGADPNRFVARLLDESMVRRADLILGMTRDHRGAVVEVWPGAVRRAFTLKEFARLLAELDPRALPADRSKESLRMVTALAATRRRQILDPWADDVVDPYRQSTEVYRSAFAELERATSTVAAVLGAGDR